MLGVMRTVSGALQVILTHHLLHIFSPFRIYLTFMMHLSLILYRPSDVILSLIHDSLCLPFNHLPDPLFFDLKLCLFERHHCLYLPLHLFEDLLPLCPCPYVYLHLQAYNLLPFRQRLISQPK
jgi:hypothetical protein